MSAVKTITLVFAMWKRGTILRTIEMSTAVKTIVKNFLNAISRGAISRFERSRV